MSNGQDGTKRMRCEEFEVMFQMRTCEGLRGSDTPKMSKVDRKTFQCKKGLGLLCGSCRRIEKNKLESGRLLWRVVLSP